MTFEIRQIKQENFVRILEVLQNDYLFFVKNVDVLGQQQQNRCLLN